MGIPLLGDFLWELNPFAIDFNPLDSSALQHERLRIFFNLIGVGVVDTPMDRISLEGLLNWVMDRAHEATPQDFAAEPIPDEEFETVMANRRKRDQIDDRRAERLYKSIAWQLGMGNTLVGEEQKENAQTLTAPHTAADFHTAEADRHIPRTHARL